VSQSFNILPMDGPAFRCWARLMHRQSDTLYEDAMIAAIATVHQLMVVTRNTRDFQGFGVVLLNPSRWCLRGDRRAFHRLGGAHR
jgi:predicted nucleic acid-binding protein